MAGDEGRGVILMNGGARDGKFLDDTWVWKPLEEAWEQLFPVDSPPGLAGHTLTYNPSTRRIVLVGGSTAKGFSDKVFEWDGANWIPGPSLPFGIAHHAATYVEHLKQIVIHGGFKGVAAEAAADAVSLSGETWGYDGKAWNMIATGPSVQFGSLVSRGDSLLSIGGAPGDAYRYDFPKLSWERLDWFQRVDAVNTASFWDPETAKLYMEDGEFDRLFTFATDAMIADDDFTSEEAAQRLAYGPLSPSRGSGARGASVTISSVLHSFIYGGSHAVNGENPTIRRVDPEGLPRATTSIVEVCDGSPKLEVKNVAVIGGELVVDVLVSQPGPTYLINGLSKVTWGPFNLPLDLNSTFGLGIPGCAFLRTDPFVVLPVNGPITIPIPNDLSLFGKQLFQQPAYIPSFGQAIFGSSAALWAAW